LRRKRFERGSQAAERILEPAAPEITRWETVFLSERRKALFHEGRAREINGNILAICDPMGPAA